MHRLAAAVSNAGGLGVIGAAGCSPEELREEIRRTRELTDKPFAVDLLAPIPDMMRPHMPVLIEEKVKIFVAGLAVPAEFIRTMHDHGMKVVVMCGKVHHGEKAAAGGRRRGRRARLGGRRAYRRDRDDVAGAADDPRGPLAGARGRRYRAWQPGRRRADARRAGRGYRHAVHRDARGAGGPGLSRRDRSRRATIPRCARAAIRASRAA